MISPTTSDSDTHLMARAVNDLVRRTNLPVAFGGYEQDGAIHVSAVTGARTKLLDSLVVRATRGLGGAAFEEKRPRLAIEYRSARGITHDYDHAVLGEGISTLFAVPVVVAGRARGVVYCGSWSQAPIGDNVSRSAFGVADELATELRVRDEVDRRMSLIAPSESGSAVTGAAREELRESFAELRSIAANVQDAALRERLSHLERRLAALSSDVPEPSLDIDVRLSPRETDVLACAALGATNAEIGQALSLKEGTVKSYLQSAMSKLDASTRHAAVARARRLGLLP
ncbi:LuxR C-terminal-related transcriptional regulator [Microbacterium sp. RU33B]|uniref:helix-turn-helix transcriptional regulator n=1 Tax=Microbacterium sp. RU33B TaxID=1907390 RepID=UPI0009616528|nr:regulatory protein, luxR family [Microbacterium sp. RU33B]